ncbi:metallophosphoesterase [Rubellicoccus peritrichatus]|uniref:Metallophosphoesterase n=1 Tax=Rubellicoccus peritrichatus TaxID=3080537 RepID=A0AAQ3LCY2_9BACT|nr:metallophosphoesterase [Puniceicoccus sp. CR14]WOO41605.1 metallophosphoesterase [Puniceicoccus sp. CR14]
MTQAQRQALAKRMGEENLKKRLKRQQLHEAGEAWQGRGLFRFEHLIPTRATILALTKVTGLYARGHRNYLDIQVVENEIHLAELPKAFDGMRILQIADLHTDLDPALPDALIPLIQELNYDICINTGDFRNRTKDSHSASMEATARIYDHIHSPCYGIFGNHDFAEKIEDLENMGIQLLLNESIPISKNSEQIWLSGIDDPHFYQSHDIKRARQSIPNDAFAIMLSHSPDTYPEVEAAGYQFMLSGHTHGGQICLPGGHALSGHVKAPRQMWRGAWQYKTLKGYTSPGTGSGTVPLRYNCPPELTIHILRKMM